MNKDRQQFKLAEFYVGGKLAHGMAMLPDYLTDLNAIHDIINKLNEQQQIDLIQHLWKMGTDGKRGSATLAILNATSAQLGEALLKALDLWETE